ncbi:chromate transporter [Methylobacterium currus]|nr:chromate transporter [Methylobacterium currus]UHC14300.1 chromate transporter [Methylobacterium currus]
MLLDVRTDEDFAADPGPNDVFSHITVFFSKMAMVTFGGAYAVLAYVAQQAVEHLGWLRPPAKGSTAVDGCAPSRSSADRTRKRPSAIVRIRPASGR